ncbi:hypothetical protein ON010_g14466 [Phytophthora cinnamomi]|nr:hypothetical protein ON010_g14466 [Phytophthora cinnamomi]
MYCSDNYGTITTDTAPRSSGVLALWIHGERLHVLENDGVAFQAIRRLRPVHALVLLLLEGGIELARLVDRVLLDVREAEAASSPIRALVLVVVHEVVALGLVQAHVRVVDEVAGAVADGGGHGYADEEHNWESAAVSGPEVEEALSGTRSLGDNHGATTGIAEPLVLLDSAGFGAQIFDNHSCTYQHHANRKPITTCITVVTLPQTAPSLTKLFIGALVLESLVDRVLLDGGETAALGLPLGTLLLVVVQKVVALGLGHAYVRVGHEMSDAIAESSGHGKAHEHDDGEGAAVSGPQVEKPFGSARSLGNHCVTESSCDATVKRVYPKLANCRMNSPGTAQPLQASKWRWCIVPTGNRRLDGRHQALQKDNLPVYAGPRFAHKHFSDPVERQAASASVKSQQRRANAFRIATPRYSYFVSHLPPVVGFAASEATIDGYSDLIGSRPNYAQGGSQAFIFNAADHYPTRTFQRTSAAASFPPALQSPPKPREYVVVVMRALMSSPPGLEARGSCLPLSPTRIIFDLLHRVPLAAGTVPSSDPNRRSEEGSSKRVALPPPLPAPKLPSQPPDRRTHGVPAEGQGGPVRAGGVLLPAGAHARAHGRGPVHPAGEAQAPRARRTPRAPADAILPNYQDPPRWIKDDLIEACVLCGVEFDLLKRKHHCRGCGLVFCGRCTAHFDRVVKFGLVEPVRLCNNCASTAQTENVFYEKFLPLLEAGDLFSKYGLLRKRHVHLKFVRAKNLLQYQKFDPESRSYEGDIKAIPLDDITDNGNNARPVQPLNGRTVTRYN